ncbi:MAG TPA: LapA family protein [Dehalococcoidia bacterium]|nr:LapA family protein [Dehalococcoidia bacterium]
MTTRGGHRERPTPAQLVRRGVGALAAAALVLFVLQNLQSVNVNFLWFEWETRMLWALIFAAVAGALATLAFGWQRGRSRERIRE